MTPPNVSGPQLPDPDAGHGNDSDAPSGRPGRRLLTSSSLGIHPGEGRLAWLFFTYFLLLATCHYVGKSVRLSTFVDSLGATNLPYAYLLVALLSYPVLLLYSRLARNVSQRVLVVAFCLAQAAGLVGFFLLYAVDTPWVAMAFYVWTTVAFGVGVSQLWSYANHVFDARQARRLFAFVGAGGLLGAIPGGQVASLAGRFGGTRWALLVAAALTLAIIVVAAMIEAQRPRQRRASHRDLVLERLSAVRGGLHAIRGSRLLILIAGLMFVSVLVGEMVDLQFGWMVEQATSTLDERTTVFGAVYSLIGLSGFLFQIIFTRRIHHRLGVGVGMRILPASLAIISIPIVILLGASIAVPLWAAKLLKLSENSFRHSVEQSTRELLFMPVRSPRRVQAKAYIDIFVQRLAKGVAAIALVPISIGLMSPAHLSWAILIVALIWLWMTQTVRREYIHAFRAGLKDGAATGAVAIDTGDATTLATLVESLGSRDPRQVLHSLELLAAHGRANLVPPLLLRHDDPLVRRTTLGVLAAAGRTDAIDLVERAIGDEDPLVRSGAIQALSTLSGENAAHLMVARLSDPDPRLRAAAIASLLAGSNEEFKQRANAALQEMLSDGDHQMRLEAARCLGDVPEPEGSLSVVQLLYDRDLAVVFQTVTSVRRRMERDGPNPLYIPILISLFANRRLKHCARQAVVAYGERAIEALVLFMRSDEEHTWVRRAVPKTLAVLGSRAAADGLTASLDVNDGFLRRKIIEALAFLRSRNQEVSFKVSTIASQIRLESQRYLRSHADLCAISATREARMEGPYPRWQTAGRVPTLLQQTLAQRMSDSVRAIFQLLQLIHDPRDIDAAFRSLLSGNPALRAHALEYLDNSLSGSVRRDVFAVLDDVPIDEKLQRAAQLYGIEVETPEETLARLLETGPGADPSGMPLTFAAIYSVYCDRVERFYPLIGSIAERAEDPVLRETAAWAMQQLGLGSSDQGSAPARPPGGSTMKEMAQIEKVVFLQGVDLFATCTAEQLVQLAAIAEIRSVPAGELIYRRNDPSVALYCVVAGSVSLIDAAGSRRTIERSDTFGVRDILSGQLRTDTATAEADTDVLEIDAEDFFDLLSMNIEIVRALFRRLTGTAPVALE